MRKITKEANEGNAAAIYFTVALFQCESAYYGIVFSKNTKYYE